MRIDQFNGPSTIGISVQGVDQAGQLVQGVQHIYVNPFYKKYIKYKEKYIKLKNLLV